MGYKNAADVLPERLLSEVQQYAEGEVLYIPKKGLQRSGWGEQCGTREKLRQRNQNIWEEYESGIPVSALAVRYYLSEKSIQHILRNRRPSLEK